MLSRDKRQENFFENQISTFDSARDHAQRIQSDDVHRNREAVREAERTKSSHTSEGRQNQGTIPMPTYATRPLTTSYQTSGITTELHGRTAKTANIRIAIRQIPYSTFIFMFEDKIQNQVTTCSDFQSDAVLWIKEVEMVDSLDEFKSSRSVYGKDLPNFEMLDAKIASALNKIQNSQFKKKVSLEEQKAQKKDQFLRGRQIAFMIYDYFRVTGAHDLVLDYADLFSVTLHDDNIQEYDTRWDEVL